jgi:hypothetical protein
MPDFETVVIAVYLLVDAFVQEEVPPESPHVGRPPGLCRAEVLTLALIAQLDRFASERAFARFAHTRLRALFPGLPDRSELNRSFRHHTDALTRFGSWCARRLGAQAAPYEILDTTAWPLRNAKRRGAGTLADVVAIGRSLRLGWFAGVRVLLAVTPEGIITGCEVAPGNTQDRTLADTFLAERVAPVQTLPGVGRAGSGMYLADTGFAGRAAQQRWATCYAAHVAAPPQPDSHDRWSASRQRWHRSARQIVETVFQRLLQGLRLERERPRTLGGVRTRLAAKVGVHNALICWNRHTGQPDLAAAEVIGW